MRRQTFVFTIAFLISFFAGVLVSSCAMADDDKPSKVSVKKPAKTITDANYKVFDIKADSMVDVDMALTRARVRKTKVLVVMGANWCHDSRALAARFDTPNFKALIAQKYELVFVSAGADSGQKDQNKKVSKRFGVDAIKGTPTVFIANPDGTVLNTESAGYWRHAHNIPTDMSLAYFKMYADK